MMLEGITQKIYYYCVYGLRISSEVYLPELITDESSSVDLQIRYGKVPATIGNVIYKNDDFQISETEFLIHIPGAATYHVANGREILVQPDDITTEAYRKLFILGTCLGIALLQRKALPIHGSSVILEGHCVIFTGVSGAGKSTISAALRRQGHSFLSDDVSVVVTDPNGIPWVQPGYPQQRLCVDSLSLLGEDPEQLSLVYADINKYNLPVSNGFYNRTARLHMICELATEDCESIELIQIKGESTLNLLIHNIYRTEFLGIMGLKTDLLKQCLQLLQHTFFYRLKRPKGLFTVTDQILALKNELKAQYGGAPI